MGRKNKVRILYDVMSVRGMLRAYDALLMRGRWLQADELMLRLIERVVPSAAYNERSGVREEYNGKAKQSAKEGTAASNTSRGSYREGGHSG